jgi:predicted CoA-binding protein
MSKKTMILGASTNPGRYSFIAANMLTEYQHEIVPLGQKKGKVADVEILDLMEKPIVENVDTITMYMGAERQKPFYEYIKSIRPKRVIFNPGAENQELRDLLAKNDIESENACTLVLLRAGLY